jgi:hypothetical protein
MPFEVGDPLHPTPAATLTLAEIGDLDFSQVFVHHTPRGGLHDAGIYRVKDLQGMTVEYLATLKGVGKAAVKELARSLAPYGLTLPFELPPEANTPRRRPVVTKPQPTPSQTVNSPTVSVTLCGNRLEISCARLEELVVVFRTP